MSFHDALHSHALITQVESYYRAAIGTLMSGDGLNAAVQSITLAGDKLELVYSFSDSAKRLYDSGKAVIPIHQASGRRLPWMMDRNGTIIEQAKEASTTGVRLAQATALIVSTAHIIAGLDVVKRLEASDRKLSTLVAGRASDQDAKLMRIYAEARSALGSPITPSTLCCLEELRYDLFELRQVWRGEIEHVLNTASHPHDWQLTDPSLWSRQGREHNLPPILVLLLTKFIACDLPCLWRPLSRNLAGRWKTSWAIPGLKSIDFGLAFVSRCVIAAKLLRKTLPNNRWSPYATG